MTVRADALRAHPDFPWLDPADPEGLARFLHARGWLASDEPVRACGRAGEGNMNLTLRVHTDRRSLIVKQARPWVEKYEHIAAPWDRGLIEQRFYARVAALPAVAERMPRLLAADAAARVLVLEDLVGAVDATAVYQGGALGAPALRNLAGYLRALHDGTRGRPDPAFANREMRALNHQHIFEIPLAAENGLALERYEPGFDGVAARLKTDAEYITRVRATGTRYLADGPCLVHGDFFPGSWLRTATAVWVIDPEFCFCGDPEFDLGCAVAHLALARHESEATLLFLAAYTGSDALVPYDPVWVARYAAAEVMRRLIGVAQLPIPPSDGWRAALLARARLAMLASSWEALWS